MKTLNGVFGCLYVCMCVCVYIYVCICIHVLFTVDGPMVDESFDSIPLLYCEIGIPRPLILTTSSHVILAPTLGGKRSRCMAYCTVSLKYLHTLQGSA